MGATRSSARPLSEALPNLLRPLVDDVAPSATAIPHALLKELLRSRSFKTRQEARSAIFDWIEAWYNPARRHSRLGNISPDQYEHAHDGVSTERPDINYKPEDQKAA